MLQYRQHESAGQHDQKGTSQADVEHDLDQDREQVNADNCLEESLAMRGDEPVSELYIWGNDYYGQLGVGSEKVIHNLPKVCSFNIVVTDVSCGEDHTVFVQGDGGYVYAMGSNSEGRLGTGNADIRSCNVPTLVDGLCNIKKVSCGSSHTLALSEDGKAYAWGQAFYGALGIAPNERGALENAHTPMLLPSEAFANEAIKDLQAGGRHSIFVTERNKLFGCGDANQGQLGLGDANRDRVLEPTQIKDSLQGMEIVQVACGKYHTLILLDNPSEGSRRELWAFGANNFGQIGNNLNQNMFSPVRVDPRMPDDKHSASQRSHRFHQVSAWHASAAVTEEGIMYVWGSGIFGEFKRPRKVKLQNNIKVNRVIVGGSFIVIVDQDSRIVVWGSNQNGEIGVGDSKIRSHPTRLETIEEKTVSHVSVGGSYAFAIGKTTNRMENSIFDEGNRSQLSGIQKNGTSHMMDGGGYKDNERNNRSINSLEEQLQQIALHSASKKRQDSDQKSRPPQDRSFGSQAAANAAASANRFEPAAARTNIQHQSSDDRGKGNDEQVAYLRQIIEEKERKIAELTDMQHLKHEEYQEKLNKFKQMQDQELGMTTKLREENKKLRAENDSLRDEIEALRRDTRLAEEQRRREDPSQTHATLHSAPTPKAETQNQRSSSYVPLGSQQETSASRSNIQPISNNYGGPAASSTQQPLPSSYVPSTPTQNSYSGLNNLQPREQLSQPERTYSQPQTSGPSTHYQYEVQPREDPMRSNLAERYSPAPKLTRTAIDEVNERVSVNDERFKSTYLRAEEHASYSHLASRAQPDDMLRAEPTDQRARDYGGASNQPSSGPMFGQRSSQGAPEASKQESNAGYGKLENLYKQRYSDAYPGHIQLHTKHERISVDVEQVDRSRHESSGKKDYQRSYTGDAAGSSGFARQGYHQNEPNDGTIADHARRASQNDDERRSTHELSSSYARRENVPESTSQGRLGTATSASHSGLYPARDRVNTGRVENLRSMGSELMRPTSRDGAVAGGGGSILLHHKLENQEQQQYAARSSATNFYQPPTKYTARTGGDYRRTEEEERLSHNGHGQARDEPAAQQQMTNTGLPDPADIQQRLKQANRYSQQLERSPDKVRSNTPNAVSTTTNTADLLQSRVSYKPSNYERSSYQPAEQNEGTRGGYGYSPATHLQRRENDDSGRKPKSDYTPEQPSVQNNKEQSYQQLQRPGSASRPGSFYQTQNSGGALASLQYDRYAPSTSNEGAYANMNNREPMLSQSRPDHEFKSSPGKPPRQEQARSSTEFASLSSKFQYGSQMPGAKTESQGDEMAGSRPPVYRPNDYQTRYSSEIGHRGGQDGNIEEYAKAAADQPDNNDAQSKYGRLSIDNSRTGADLTQLSGPSSHTPSYTNNRVASSEDYGNENRHQYSSSFQGASQGYQPKSLAGGENIPQRRPENQQHSNDLLPNSYSTFGGNQTMNFSQKPRSPFTMQQINQQVPATVDQANRVETGYQSKINGQASSYPQNMGMTSFTPQGSGRRGASLTENRSNGGGGEGEDIRTKLARYKKEREDFELIRQQFRKKNSELSTSAANVTTQQQNQAGISENTPVNRSMSGSHKFQGLASADYNASGAAKGNNIFAVENSGGSQVKAFTASGHMTSGSPAFGLPEQSQSREH